MSGTRHPAFTPSWYEKVATTGPNIPSATLSLPSYLPSGVADTPQKRALVNARSLSERLSAEAVCISSTITTPTSSGFSRCRESSVTTCMSSLNFLAPDMTRPTSRSGSSSVSFS